MVFGAAFTLLTAALPAQDLDSLRAVWQDASRPDSSRFLACYDLVWDGYLFTNADSALLLAQTMESQAKARGQKRFVALSYDLQAAAHYVKGDMRKALDLYAISLPLHEAAEQPERVADVIGNMAGMYLYLGEHQKALDLYERALRQHTEGHDTIGMANDINAMGAVHLARGDHARATDHFHRGLRMLRQQGEKRGVISGLINLGAINSIQSEHSKAIAFYSEALESARAIGDQDLIAKCLLEIGSSRQELGDTAETARLLTQALDIAQELGNQRLIATVHNKQGDLALLQGADQRALELYTRARAIADANELHFSSATATIGAGRSWLAMGRPERALIDARSAVQLADTAEELSLQRDAAELMFNVLNFQHKSAEALPWHLRFVSLRDSLVREENLRASISNDFAYAHEKQLLADSLARYEERIQHAGEVADHRSRNRLLLAALAVVILLAAAIWSRMREMRRHNAQILEAQQQVVQAEIAAKDEQVRTRIARDIHDDIGSGLTKIALLGNDAKRRVQDQSDELRHTLDRIIGHSREVSAALSDIVWSVDPEHDTSLELVNHARLVAQRMLEGSGVLHDLQFDHIDPAHTVAPGTKHHVVMVMKEAINNALKYAEATRITVQLQAGAHHVKLVVTDNGKGFDPQAMARAGNGLRNMRARAESIGTAMTVESAPGKGCTIELEGVLT